MKKITLLLFAIAFVSLSCFAQITIADEEGNPIEDGGTYGLFVEDGNGEVPIIITNNSASSVNYIFIAEEWSGSITGVCEDNPVVGEPGCYSLDFTNPGEQLGPLQILTAGESTTALTHVIYTFSGSESFTLTVQEEGNASNSITFTFNNPSVGINSEKSNFSVYPNPAKDVLYIKNTNNAQSYVLISNIIGQTVKRVDLKSETTKVNISDLESGVYIYTLYENNKVSTSKKLIKK